MSEKTKLWLKCAGVRAIKTVAQTAVATIGPNTKDLGVLYPNEASSLFYFNN